MNSDASFLRRLPLFANVPSESLERLEHRMRTREFVPTQGLTSVEEFASVVSVGI